MASEPSGALILALFLAAAAGWMAARYLSQRTTQRPRRSDRPMSEQYFEGLNFLLNEEPDKALDVFIRMVEVDNETVETHLALGSLYRRRGEVDRAIRVHENIIARQSLKPEHREHAMFALGEDYLRAGLFDRAEHLFLRLTEAPGRRTPALRNLLRIYEQQGDWPQAIQAYEKLTDLASPEHPTAIAHYYCELADAARQRGALDEARELLRKVRARQRNFPRGALIRADVALDMNDAHLAARLCRRVVDLHPQLLPLALQRFARAVRTSEARNEAAEGLRPLVRPEPAARAQLAYAAIIAGLEAEPFVAECLRDLIREDPTLSDLVPALAGDPTQLSDTTLQTLAVALGRVFRRTQRYRCLDCGFSTASHFWQCPGCRSWDTLAPVARVELAPATRAR